MIKNIDNYAYKSRVHLPFFQRIRCKLNLIFWFRLLLSPYLHILSNVQYVFKLIPLLFHNRYYSKTFKTMKVNRDENLYIWAPLALIQYIMSWHSTDLLQLEALVSVTLWIHTRRIACQKWSRERGRTSRTPLLDLPHHFPSLRLRIRSRRGHSTPGLLADICFMGH